VSPEAAGGGLVVAPTAPGRLGDAAPASDLLVFLSAMDEWRSRRKAELDRLDEAAQASRDGAGVTPDITLSMALWQAVDHRCTELHRVWDSGRADRTAREQMGQLVWGRLDGAGPSALSVSLPEACRLSDALAAQLRMRLSFDAAAAEAGARVTALRASLERCRALAEHEVGEQPRVGALAARVEDVAATGARGGDVTGPLALLEADVARAERDLIVATATRRESDRAKERDAARVVRDRLRATSELTVLERREQRVRALADRCVLEIASPPRLAVPDVSSLPPVPDEAAGAAALDTWLATLDRVALALDVVERAYAGPLDARDELLGRMQGYRVMAARLGRDSDPDVQGALARADAALRAHRCDVDAAESFVTSYQQLVRAATVAGGTS
jgi:hypothetical protein